MLHQPNLDASTAGDPLIQAIGELAGRYGLAFSPALFDSLARDGAGRLPFHQAGAAIEVAGLDFEEHNRKRLPTGTADYPALISLAEGGVAVIHEAKDGDLLVWTPDAAEARWMPRDEL